MKNTLTCCSFILLAFARTFAQNTAPGPDTPTVMVVGGVGSGVGVSTQNFFYREIPRGGEFVKSAPYTATAITETTQVLADGNRIVNKSSALLARDSEGRTRREETMSKVGPLPVNATSMVFINDPTDNSDYLLNVQEQTADVLRHQKGGVMTVEQRRVIETKIKTDKSIQVQELGDVKRESLGTQVIEGLSCEGQLETQTIPAGSIGNERSITITSETWASPDLHLLVMRKRNDPRFGETLYKLTDIKRVEPDPSLFKVPGNFKILDKLPALQSPLE